MKNLKIEIPEGYEIDKEKSTFDEIVFKKSKKENEREERFLELFQNLTIKSDVEKYPDSVFYFRGARCLLETEKQYLWVSNKHIWFIFEREFDMNYKEIHDLIKGMVEKHFKWRDLTPKTHKKAWASSVEKHFNSK